MNPQDENAELNQTISLNGQNQQTRSSQLSDQSNANNSNQQDNERAGFSGGLVIGKISGASDLGDTLKDAEKLEKINEIVEKNRQQIKEVNLGVDDVENLNEAENQERRLFAEHQATKKNDSNKVLIKEGVSSEEEELAMTRLKEQVETMKDLSSIEDDFSKKQGLENLVKEKNSKAEPFSIDQVVVQPEEESEESLYSQIEKATKIEDKDLAEIEKILDLAKKKGPVFALSLAEKLNDNFLIDKIRDDLAWKKSKGFFDVAIEKKQSNEGESDLEKDLSDEEELSTVNKKEK